MQKSQKPKKRLGNSISVPVVEDFTTGRIFAPHGAAVPPCLHRCQCLRLIFLSVDKLRKQWIKHCNSSLSYSRWPMIFQYLQSSCFSQKADESLMGFWEQKRSNTLQLHKTYFSVTKVLMGLGAWQWHSFARAAGDGRWGGGTERRAHWLVFASRPATYGSPTIFTGRDIPITQTQVRSLPLQWAF